MPPAKGQRLVHTKEIGVTIERQTALLQGTLIKRYHRFLADIELATGEKITAHCMNTGSMEGLIRPGSTVWVSHNPAPNRKLHYTWEYIEIDDKAIGVNTSTPNRIVGELIDHKQLSPFAHYDVHKREYRYGENSRVDHWLKYKRNEIYIEVKNVHLIYEDNRAYFPDGVSERASKHLEELAKIQSKTVQSWVLFFVQLPGVKSIRPSDVHDPIFAKTAREVAKNGVQFVALEIDQTPTTIEIKRWLPVDLGEYDPTSVKKWRKQNKKPVVTAT